MAHGVAISGLQDTCQQDEHQQRLILASSAAGTWRPRIVPMAHTAAKPTLVREAWCGDPSRSSASGSSRVSTCGSNSYF